MRISTSGAFFFPKAKSLLKKERKFVCRSPLLMVAPCRGASKPNRSTSTPKSQLLEETVSFTHARKLGSPKPKKIYTKTKQKKKS